MDFCAFYFKFRFEWGRWVDDGNMEELQEQLNKIKIPNGGKIYDRLLAMEKNVALSSIENEYDDDSSEEQIGVQDAVVTREKEVRRFRLAGEDHWDCILHVLPKGMEWSGRWPTGSWAVVRALTGLVEIAMLRGPDRNGMMNKVATTKLRGGSDGTLGSGRKGAGGQDSVKYVGGVQRTYIGVSGKSMLLEVVLRPPIGDAGKDGDGRLSVNIQPLSPDEIFMDGLEDVEEAPVKEEDKPTKELLREKPAAKPTVNEEEFMEDKIELWGNDVTYDDEFYGDELERESDKLKDDRFYDDLDDKEVQRFSPRRTVITDAAMKGEESVSLSTKMGLTFKKIGGLDEQLDAIVRRVLATR
jgi:hypothetical protein